MHTVEEARAQILATIEPLPGESVTLADAVGRWLCVPVASRRNVPGFDNAAMDGFAVRSLDVATATHTAPTTLSVHGAVHAGAPLPDFALTRATSLRINTGAPIPPGADAVVMRELTDESRVSLEGLGDVDIRDAAPPGQHIRRRGEDVRAGRVVVDAGVVVTPARLNLLAQSGHAVVRVHRRPTVAILASGDELRELGEPAGDLDVVNSNAHAIAAAVRAAGGVPLLLGIARDTLDDHVAYIAAAGFADVLLTIGGVSMGTHDFARPALAHTGAVIELWKIAMRPGKPLAFGTRGAQRIFGLPGNPVSSLVAFELFVRPALLSMQGALRVVRQPVRATFTDAQFRKRPGLAFYARAHVTMTASGFAIALVDKQGSGQVSGLAAANALAIFARDGEGALRGDVVEALLLDDSPFMA